MDFIDLIKKDLSYIGSLFFQEEQGVLLLNTFSLWIYESMAPPAFRQKILSGSHFSLEEIEGLCQFLLPQSRKPRSHKTQVDMSTEAKILSDFFTLHVGSKKLLMILSRKGEAREHNLTLWKIRWVYKRNHLRVQKIRTKNGETRALYNYRTLWAFEDIHYDTKEIADQKSLPEWVYKNLKYNENLPIYEWNIMDMASRSRFIAYSRGKSSTFWLMFIVLVISHLRYCGVATAEWWWHHIRLHTDWWAEFFSGSEKKQKEWNDLLSLLDASIDCYNPNWDIRKNVIERSHRSDDEEFLIPFGESMKTKEQFMIQAQEYSDYWNMKRPHSWHGMDGRTPEEQLIKRGLPTTQVKRILQFKVLHLDESFSLLQEHIEYFYLQRDLRNLTDTTKNPLWREDRKGIIDCITKYPEKILQDYAQNVLTYYLIPYF